ncbi:ATP-binding protein [Leptospira borgpetersenii]|uniref:AAA domain protein n=2 Tax=Leptospira borgpetersenii TaxID=174 RepID=M3GX27_LEPBO|nr:ATP-binding protein [Leptospira borgpetersenii]EKP13043.1 AAA domain protein [Leptospira borgpetersenii str. 200801926]EMF99398.1 AAA domain protein [Leptospira borgpetersenii str. 200701203]ENO65402.1 AAA domain protein [Leptospira borgpetersenii serovar Mini str. 201000851]
MNALLTKRPDFVNTRNTDKITKLAYRAVKNNSWLAVTGEVGMGKTYLYNNLLEFFDNQPQKYILVHVGPAWESALGGLSIAFVMKHMIRSIRPGERVPGNLNEKYFKLRELLIWARSIGRKVVLVIDEAQALRVEGLRDLKKVWEIAHDQEDHLFSILMFMKPETRISSILSSPEIGYRTIQAPMSQLNHSELIQIAEEGFKVKFERGKVGEKTKELLIRGCRFRTPLAVRNTLLGIAFAYPEVLRDSIIRENHVRNFLSDGYLRIMDRLKISVKQLRAGIKERYQKDLDKATIENALSGEGEVSPEIEAIVKNELVNRIRNKTRKYDGTIFTENT